ncbi:MAG: TetR/AcrR family transcriptional regulator [Roseiflexaceae bacterium]
MPKGFTDREKALIRAGLLEKGRELFAAYGVRKTNVEDLTRAVGISKGAFYLFFDSKEELFFELLEQFESDFQVVLLEHIARDGAPPRERMRALLREALSVWKHNALFAHFSREEYEYLFRKLPPAKMQAHLSKDDAFAVEFAAAWRRADVAIAREPILVSGLIRALFFISLHEEEFGDGIYPNVIDVYIELLSSYLIPGE